MLCRDNLIFDTGTIKLADFGLSKSLPVNKHAGYDLDSKFKLTGETGSYRYMAPEVFRHEPYNFKVCSWTSFCPFFELILPRIPTGYDLALHQKHFWHSQVVQWCQLSWYLPTPGC